MHRCASSKRSDTRDERVVVKGKDSKSLDRSISYFQLSDTRLCDVKGNLSSHHRAEQEADKAGIPDWSPWPWKMFRVEEEAAFPPLKGCHHLFILMSFQTLKYKTTLDLIVWTKNSETFFKTTFCFTKGSNLEGHE